MNQNKNVCKKISRKSNDIRKLLMYVWKKRNLYILLIPGIVYFLVFCYGPMYGIILAFKDFNFAKGIMGSDWVGLDNFKHMFEIGDFYKVFFNSLYLNVLKMICFFPMPIVFSLMLNEMGNKFYKRTTQTLIYLPYFISWVVIGGIMINFLSPSWGMVNLIIKSLGLEPVFFMGNAKYFRPIIVATEIWKGAGWDTILYLAAISTINPELYEATLIDGADRLQRIRYIIIPHIKFVIIIVGLIRIGYIMNNGFEQIFIFQNLNNLQVSEVFETYIYKFGILYGQFSFTTAVGLFTAVIGTILLVTGDRLAKALGQGGLF